MKKSDLKNLIKPVVKECIQEILLEEGLLSNVVAEVAKGMQGNLMTESPKKAKVAKPRRDEATARKKLDAHRAKLRAAINQDAYNGVDLFENVTPAASPAVAQASAGHADLGDPRDAGVNIDSLINGAANVWKAMK